MGEDTLSRPEVGNVSLPSVNYAEMAALQDPTSVENFSLQMERVSWKGLDLWCNTSQTSPRPLVSEKFRIPIFSPLHALSHPGACPSIKMLSSRFVWPGLRADMHRWCCECHACQASKVARHTRAPVTIFPSAQQRFGSVHLDIVGPLPPSNDCRYLLTMVD